MSWGMNILFHAASNSIVKKKAIGERITGKIFITYPLTICMYLVFVDGFSNGGLIGSGGQWFQLRYFHFLSQTLEEEPLQILEKENRERNYHRNM
jgi:hypothetical protein